MFFFTGPVLLTFAMVFEWIMGNFFPMMVMGLFSVFWLSFGMLQLPGLGLGLPFATTSDPTGTGAAAYNAAIGLYLVVWGFALLTFFFFTLKINIVFATIFGLVTTASWILAGAYFKVAAQDYDTALSLQKVSEVDLLNPLVIASVCVCAVYGILTVLNVYRPEEPSSSSSPSWAGTLASSSWRPRCASPSTCPWATSPDFGPRPTYRLRPRTEPESTTTKRSLDMLRQAVCSSGGFPGKFVA